ncbi:uncharacterized protein G2W53_036486 [Senna tora]|uniref:Uncharacterized protein n=1 Tax=Senna tora TaxID=362788 RepID=A0A834SUG3_9FABA|nr:uncharacterized protein G2W53_036486 [Senna tora]
MDWKKHQQKVKDSERSFEIARIRPSELLNPPSPPPQKPRMLWSLKPLLAN